MLLICLIGINNKIRNTFHQQSKSYVSNLLLFVLKFENWSNKCHFVVEIYYCFVSLCWLESNTNCAKSTSCNNILLFWFVQGCESFTQNQFVINGNGKTHLWMQEKFINTYFQISFEFHIKWERKLHLKNFQLKLIDLKEFSCLSFFFFHDGKIWSSNATQDV